MKSTDLVKELRALSINDLKKRYEESQEELSSLVFQGATQALTNPVKLRTLRRTIARINTVLNEK